MAEVVEEFQRNFRVIVEKIFNNWQNLRLAVEHGMGGCNGQQVAIQIMDYIYQYCIGNENITPGELQEVLEDLMDQEFNTLCDDNSIPEICRNLLRYKQMSKQGQYALVEQELSQLPQGKQWLRSDVKITYTPIAGESSSSDEEMDTDDDGDGTEDKHIDTYNRMTTRSQSQKNQQAEFVEPEEGWTTVRSRRK